MNIAEMTDQEKSVMLARLCGWNVELLGDDVWVRNSDDVTIRLSAPSYLYNYKWMFLAWRVLNFASKQWNNVYCWGWGIDKVTDFELEPAKQIRAWLDKILALAIEAGMVTK